jgi:hypothetical protein
LRSAVLSPDVLFPAVLSNEAADGKRLRVAQALQMEKTKGLPARDRRL